MRVSVTRAQALALCFGACLAVGAAHQATTAKQRIGLPPGYTPPKLGKPGPWMNIKPVYIPGEHIALGDPMPADQANAIDPTKVRVFIKNATDTWELSPILVSGSTLNNFTPSGNPFAPGEVDDNASFGPRAAAIGTVVPQLPLGRYDVWFEQGGTKGAVKSIQITPRLKYTIVGVPTEGSVLKLSVEISGPIAVPKKAGTADPAPPAADIAPQVPADTAPAGGAQVLKAPVTTAQISKMAGFLDRLKAAGGFSVPITLKTITPTGALALADSKAKMTESSDEGGEVLFELKALKSGETHLEFDAPGFESLGVNLSISPKVKPLGLLPKPIVGFADIHAHFMSHLGFNGSFVGKPFDEDGLEAALRDCEYRHGPWGVIPNLESGDGLTHPTGGYPEFDGWPRFTSKSHQTAYYKWIERTYKEGGLRLATMLAVNNELVGKVSSELTIGIPKSRPFDDKRSIDDQIKGMWKMVEFVDKENGGHGKGWMQIALSPESAYHIMSQGKLAIVLGIEVDSLGNWRKPEDIDKASGGDDNKARQLIRAELKRLHAEGVRQICPIHLTDNAFGGCAVYNKIFSALNKFVTGHYYDVEDARSSGIHYNIGKDDFALPPRILLGQVAPKAMDGYGDWDASINRSWGTANKRGLTKYGRMLIEEMMDLGMVLDMDHFSQKSLHEAMAITEQRMNARESKYPFTFSHCSFREMKLSPSDTSETKQTTNEGDKTAEDLARLKASGGVCAIGLVQGNVKTFPNSKVANDSAGSSKSWAQSYQYLASKMNGFGLALGSDVNGGPGAPTPRFGSFASEALHPKNDDDRGKERRKQAEAQTNGVKYDGKWKDYRRYRFDEDDGVYDDEEREVWEGLALAKSGANIDDADVFHWNRAVWDSKEVQYFAEGFRAGKTTKDESKWEKRAAWLAKEDKEPSKDEDSEVFRLLKKTKRIWKRWQAMESGDNAPLKRSKAGRRDFDINIDGVAHYGLLPDFFADVKNVGLTAKDLSVLMHSASDYVTMWEKCERMSHRQ